METGNIGSFFLLKLDALYIFLIHLEVFTALKIRYFREGLLNMVSMMVGLGWMLEESFEPDILFPK